MTTTGFVEYMTQIPLHQDFKTVMLGGKSNA